MIVFIKLRLVAGSSWGLVLDGVAAFFLVKATPAVLDLCLGRRGYRRGWMRTRES